MVLVIGEPVRRAQPGRLIFIIRFGLFGVSVIIGSAALAAVVALLGHVLLPDPTIWLGVVALILGCTILLRETFVRSIPLPQRRGQLPRSWTEKFWGGAIAYGAGMGMGIFTYTPSAIFHLYLLICFLAGSASLGAAIGALYGVVFISALAYATLFSDPEFEAERSSRVADRARLVGALAAPLLPLMPTVWPLG